MTRKVLPALIGAFAVALSAMPAEAGPRGTPEERLQRELRGRVAGEAVECINLRNVRGSQVIDRTAILFDAGSTIYVNRPRGGAESLDRFDTQVVRLSGAYRLCSIDTIQMVDPTTGMFTGNVFLGDFVPYRRVRN